MLWVLVRADPADPSAEAHERALVGQAVAVAEPNDVLVTDRTVEYDLLHHQ